MIAIIAAMGVVGPANLQFSVPKVEASNTEKSLTDEQVVLLHHQFKVMQSGSGSIVGEVKNIGNDNVDSVQVFASTFDKNGEIIEQDAINSTVGELKAGQKSSFNLTAPSDKFGDIYDYDLSIQWADSVGQEHRVDSVNTYAENETSANLSYLNSTKQWIS